jgi:hypothetical protein
MQWRKKFLLFHNPTKQFGLNRTSKKPFYDNLLASIFTSVDIAKFQRRYLQEMAINQTCRVFQTFKDRLYTVSYWPPVENINFFKSIVLFVSVKTDVNKFLESVIHKMFYFYLLTVYLNLFVWLGVY